MLNQHIQLPDQEHPELFLIAIGEKAKETCFKLLHDLRQEGVPSQMDFSSRKVTKLLQYADQIGAAYVAVIGDVEMEKGEVELKLMATGDKLRISISDVVKTLTQLKK